MMGKNFVNSNVSQLAGASGKETRNRYVKPVSAEVALITDAYFLNVSMYGIEFTQTYMPIISFTFSSYYLQHFMY